MLAVLPLLIALIPNLQDPTDPVVARFDYPGGGTGTVTRNEVAREVAQRQRHTEDGERAIKLLVDRHLVALEADRAKLMPTAAEIDQRIDEISAVLSSQGSTLDDFLKAKRMSRERFGVEFMRLQIAHERLVVTSLELKSRDEVTPDLLELWLVEARGRHTIVDDPTKLPADTVVQVDDRRFHLEELGLVLLPNVAEEERAKFIRRVVLRELLQREADSAGIKVTQADTRAEIERRRERIESDPRYRGIGYEEWLRTTQGMTIDELARSPQMVATVQQARLVETRFSTEELAKRLSDDRAAVLRRHGERRKVAIVLLRAVERPNEVIRRDFAAALEEASALRTRIVAGKETFQRIAQINSEDPYSKVRGGELGEFASGSEELPAAILEAAFALPLFGVSEPIRVGQGVLLVRVNGIEPAPGDAELIERMREEAGQEFLARQLDAAKIEILN